MRTSPPALPNAGRVEVQANDCSAYTGNRRRKCGGASVAGPGGPAGQVSIGIPTAGGDALRDALATGVTATRRRAPALRIAPGLVVMVDAHSADGQALRDPILREWRVMDL